MATVEEPLKIHSRPKDDMEDDEKAKIEADNKDKRLIDEAVERIRERKLTNTKNYTWELMAKEYKIYQKQNQNKKTKEKQRLSQLIDETNDAMCKNGHGSFDFYDNEKYIKYHPCIMCGSMKERKFCDDCTDYDKQRLGNENYGLHIYCKHCRILNADNIKERIRMDKFKADIIRSELIETPELEMDILCNMPRMSSVKSLIDDINKRDDDWRHDWCLFTFDMDHLKCWNDNIGHIKTDLLIKKIGSVMKKYVDEINNEKWWKKEKGFLNKAFVYRTGGDEFCMAIGCGINGAYSNPLGPFYFSLKKEINGIGSNICDLFFENEENEEKQALEALSNATNRKGERINMNIVGISTGLFIPAEKTNNEMRKEKWLYFSDKKALKHAKSLNKPNKNNIAIYYEQIGGLILDEKTLKCLENGIYKGLK